MLTGRFVFAELVSHLSPRAFRTCVERYDGNYKASRFFGAQVPLVENAQ